MKLYKITIINNISNRKRRVKVETYNISDALEIADGKINQVYEEIIKIEVWNTANSSFQTPKLIL